MTKAGLRAVLERRDHGFRWRGESVSRIEGLSDAVFGFAITLLVVSLNAPRTFTELTATMSGFGSFAICFALLLTIWHAQYIYFRRYALDDGTSFMLNAALLFVVAFYVYPLRFLFSVFVNGITGHRDLDAAGAPIRMMTGPDWRPLMMIYSAGFMALYTIFSLLYLHAYRQRTILALNDLECYETRGVVQENALMLGIGTIAFGFAWLGIPQLSGISYALIAPLQTLLGWRHGRGRKRIAAAP